ncbi:hypothetical protein QR680_000831 [Steinernema hermaphroditum]|uniref:Uncharacterized protein n=1 Tax=Steinernema hermaphroditum TaxID=289476 RepID=A0AA39GWR9_9BILA|nr:hypothetical protein QR680_000831 [Steinernema hermaphroditum]
MALGCIFWPRSSVEFALIWIRDMNLRNGKNVKKKAERDTTPELLLDIRMYEEALQSIPLDDVETHIENGTITMDDVENAEQYAHQAVAIVTLFAQDLAEESDLSMQRMMEIIDNLGDRLKKLYLEAVIDARRNGRADGTVGGESQS